MKMFHACMVAAAHSGAGKTTVLSGLAALARLKGLTVQPFKGGPDYIDPGFHEKGAGRKSRNLDLFLLSEDAVRESFARNSQDADVALVEGMMGLYDGKGPEAQGSSAQIAKTLGIPVILVLDGSGMAGSAAAIVLGFQQFDPQVKLAGVFFNRVNHDGHFQYLKQAVEAKTGIPCLGFLPENSEIEIPERHLGLTTASERENAGAPIEKAAGLLEKHFDWNRFLEVSKLPLPKGTDAEEKESGTSGKGTQVFSRRFKIAVARDKAFSFYYEDNLDLLQQAGARLVFFSPLEDGELPAADLVYLGGGFPEIYAETLSKNSGMILSLRNFYYEGGWIYAECGGLMYLSQAFCDAEGREFPLAGIIPGKTRMTARLQNFGYKECEAAPDHFLFQAGQKVRTHEFHHSVWDEEGKHKPAYFLGPRREGFAGPRLIATYQHLHFGSVPGTAAALIHTIEKERNFVC